MKYLKPNVKVTTAPTTEPVSLASLKAFIRQYDTTHDTLLTSLLKSVRIMAEGYQNRAYITQTITMSFDYLPYGWFQIPRPPYASITSITFYDEDSAATTMSAATYFDIDTSGMIAQMRLKEGVSYPAASPRAYGCLVIVYVAGGADSTVSEHTKNAICLGVQSLFDDPLKELPDAFYRLLDFDRAGVNI